VVTCDYRGNYVESVLIATIRKTLALKPMSFGELLVGNKRSSTVQRPMLPGEALMLGPFATRRSTPRVPTRRTAWMTFKSLLEHEHLALVKDISAKGVFFYSDFHPDVGDQLEFVVEFLSGSDRVRLHLKGKVVRVEQAAPGSARGVAVSFYLQRVEAPLLPATAR